MKVLPWIFVAAGAALVAFYAIAQPRPRYATGNDDLEDADNETSSWGTRQRIHGTGETILGKVEKGLGEITGNDDLRAEGAGDQLLGSAKDAAGQTAHAVGQTLHDLNQ